MFAKVEYLLPFGTWATWHNESNQSELENEFVIVFEGSTVLNSLNLDFPFDETEHVFLILIKGDLTVKQYMYNEETDGAAGLIVLGDLWVGNMLVGGQEGYVTGKLTVDEVFWGDYNYGDVRVLGIATATAFVETDLYFVNILGQTNFDHYSDQCGSQDNTVASENGSRYQGLS